LTIIFVFATVTIPSYAAYAGGSISVVVLVALFVTLIPTTIGALLSAIGIAGMDRLDRKSTRLNSSHQIISYAVFCLKKKNTHSVQDFWHARRNVTSAQSSAASGSRRTASRKEYRGPARTLTHAGLH